MLYLSGQEYELYCAEYLKSLGYEQVHTTPVSGDQGVDLVAVKDNIKYAFQCKYYTGSVGNKAIQEVYAGAGYYGCKNAVVITNSHLTPKAIELADKLGVDVMYYVPLEYDESQDSFIDIPDHQDVQQSYYPDVTYDNSDFIPRNIIEDITGKPVQNHPLFNWRKKRAPHRETIINNTVKTNSYPNSTSKPKKRKSGWLLWILVLIVIIAIASTPESSRNNASPSSVPSTPSLTSKSKTSDDDQPLLGDMYWYYTNNPASAIAKYSGHSYTVEGTVISVRDYGKTADIELYTGPTYGNKTITAYFNERSNFAEGDTITFSGTCGDTWGIWENCKVIS